MEMLAKEHPLIKSPLTNPWIWLIGIVFLSALFCIVDTNIGWRSALKQWQGVPIYSVVISYFLFITSHIIRSIRIFFLLSLNNQDMRLSANLPIVMKASALHQFFNNLLPMRMGELSLPLLLKRYFAISWGNGFSKLIWLRIFDALIMAIVAGVVFTAFLYANWYLGLIGIMVTSGVFALAYVIGRLKGKKLNSVLTTFVDTAPPTKKSALILCALTFLAWFSKLAALSLIVQALGDMKAIAALSAIVSVEFGALLPVNGIAGAGNFEATFFAGASLFENVSAELLAIAVNLHIFVFLSTTSLAVFTLPIRQHQPKRSFTPVIEATPCASK